MIKNEIEKSPIIILNGASGAGKTSIAKELQKVVGMPSIHLSEDMFFDASMGASFGGTEEERVYALRVLSGFYRSIRNFSASGMIVIVDVVLEDWVWFKELVEQLQGYEVFFVAIKCPLEELERREIERKDRSHIGLPKSHFNLVHSHHQYDFEIDTSKYTSKEAACQIASILKKPHSFKAFSSLPSSEK